MIGLTIFGIVILVVVLIIILSMAGGLPFAILRNHRTSKVWDRKLNELMKQYKFTERRECTAQLGAYTIWISNHPYASFNSYKNGEIPESKLPGRLTAMRAWKKLNQECPIPTDEDRINKFENNAKQKSRRK